MGGRDLLQAILDSPTSHAIMFMDPQGVVRLWNAGAERIFLHSGDDIVGHDFRRLFILEDRERGLPEQEMRSAEELGCAGDFRWNLRRDGTRFWADGMMYPVRERDGELVGYVKVLRDATERKRQDDVIARLALVDALTGLPNRAEFHQRLHELVASALRHDAPFILLLLDLDHFKEVNDRFGHAAGDALLQQVAARMREQVRETDVVARLGGDEFAILLADSTDPNAGGVVADKLVAALSQPFPIDDHEAQVGASIGISVFPQDANTADQLMRNADLALYRAKAMGRGGFQYFTQMMDLRAHQRSRELEQLARLTPEDFRLHYLPCFGADGHLAGVEALLRCTDPHFSRLPIGQVVALAAETGQLRAIGMRSLARACSQVARWQRSGWPHLHLIMNFCRMEIGCMGLADRVVDIVTGCGLDLEDFELDLAEDQLYGRRHDDPLLQQLSDKGLALTIDDFGGEHASPVRLAGTVRRIKLDLRHFPGIPGNRHSCAVADALVDLAHAVGLEVLVERVQNEAEAGHFRHRCDGMQGYHFAEPLSARQMTTWLAARRVMAVAPVAASPTRAMRH